MGYTDAPPGWWKSFVLETPPRTAKLGVVRADGSPHVAPVWVDLDGDQVVFTTGANTVKGKAILRDPRVSLCWDDERPPFSFVTIAGTARTSDDPVNLLNWATRIGGRRSAAVAREGPHLQVGSCGQASSQDGGSGLRYVALVGSARIGVTEAYPADPCGAAQGDGHRAQN